MSKIWGPKLWHLMHNISYNYKLKPNQKDKTIFLNFYISIYDIIPCPICKNFYGEFLSKIDKNRLVYNKFTLMNKLNILHNLVNKKLGKKIYNPRNIEYKCQLDKQILIELIETIYESNQLRYYSLSKFFYYFILVYPDYRIKVFLTNFYVKNHNQKSGVLKIKNEIVRVLSL